MSMPEVPVCENDFAQPWKNELGFAGKVLTVEPETEAHSMDKPNPRDPSASPLAVFWLLGAPFFRVASVFEEAVSGATVPPCSATTAAPHPDLRNHFKTFQIISKMLQASTGIHLP
jgi:hypothetical protein